MNDSPFLTVEETARLLRVCDRTLRDMTKNGMGPPAIAIGKQMRYPKHELNEWIRSHLINKSPRRDAL